MTPKNKTKLKNEAQVRSISFTPPAEPRKLIESNYYVEGYAALYEPYVLYIDAEGNEVRECFERGCFDACDMSDVIMLYDHRSHVFARTSNGSLKLVVDDVGLLTGADLGRTEGARQLYDEIQAEMCVKMSWRFMLGDYDYDVKEKMFIHHSVKKIYDVSAVSLPANDNTTIMARTWADGEISLRARRDAELAIKKQIAKTKIQIALGG